MIKKADNASDFVSPLFKRVSGDCPQIQFSDEFEKRSDPDKIKYLKNLASSCNWSANKIQKKEMS